MFERTNYNNKGGRFMEKVTYKFDANTTTIDSRESATPKKPKTVIEEAAQHDETLNESIIFKTEVEH